MCKYQWHLAICVWNSSADRYYFRVLFFSVQVNENEVLGTIIQNLTVVNQRDTVVDCRLPIDDAPTSLFSFTTIAPQKHCHLTVAGSLDYEKQTSYVLLATVEATSNSRQKRQVGKGNNYQTSKNRKFMPIFLCMLIAFVLLISLFNFTMCF